MPFGFNWKKKRETKDILIELKAIIYTSARCRMEFYQDAGLGYHVVESITQEVYDEFMKDCMKYPTNEAIIDRIDFLFKKAEARQVRIANEWKAEYGM